MKSVTTVTRPQDVPVHEAMTIQDAIAFFKKNNSFRTTPSKWGQGQDVKITFNKSNYTLTVEGYQDGKLQKGLTHNVLDGYLDETGNSPTGNLHTGIAVHIVEMSDGFVILTASERNPLMIGDFMFSKEADKLAKKLGVYESENPSLLSVTKNFLQMDEKKWVEPLIAKTTEGKMIEATLRYLKGKISYAYNMHTEDHVSLSFEKDLGTKKAVVKIWNASDSEVLNSYNLDELKGVKMLSKGVEWGGKFGKVRIVGERSN